MNLVTLDILNYHREKVSSIISVALCTLIALWHLSPDCAWLEGSFCFTYSPEFNIWKVEISKDNLGQPVEDFDSWKHNNSGGRAFWNRSKRYDNDDLAVKLISRPLQQADLMTSAIVIFGEVFAQSNMQFNTSQQYDIKHKLRHEFNVRNVSGWNKTYIRC